MNGIINYILGGVNETVRPSLIKQFLKNPDDYKILVETCNDEIVIRIRRKTDE